jgi:hypothetical protein
MLYNYIAGSATGTFASRRKIRNILRLPGCSRQELAFGVREAAVFHGTWVASSDQSSNTIPSGRPVPGSEGIKKFAGYVVPITSCGLEMPGNPGIGLERISSSTD